MTEAPGGRAPTQSEVLARGGPLGGACVVITGRLATLSRGEAERAVEIAGGRVADAVSPRTDILVVGMGGWPLLATGRVTRSLAAAEKMRAAGGSRPRILSERDFRVLVGLDRESADEPGAKTLDAASVAATLGVTTAALDRWRQLGLVRPVDGRYDFRDLVSLRTITDLVARGVSPVVIRRSLEGLTRVLPGVDRPLAQLSILVHESGELVAELEDALLSPGGQMELKFGALPGSDDPALRTRTAESVSGEGGVLSLRGRAEDAEIDEEFAELLADGLEAERANRPADAEACYRRAIDLRPGDAVAQFNLGNALLARGEPEAAAERYAQSCALDPSSARAWFNLAHAQDECGRLREAAESLRRAVRLDPGYADAHFNLAELQERLGDARVAIDGYRAFLRLDPAGSWAEEARRRIGALRDRA